MTYEESDIRSKCIEAMKDPRSHNKADGTLRILELKKPDSKETMLRCALEAFTYMRTVDKDKLVADFGLPADTAVKACPLVFLNGIQHGEWLDEKRPNLHKFMSVNDIQPFFVERTGSGYKVYSEVNTEDSPMRIL